MQSVGLHFGFRVRAGGETHELTQGGERRRAADKLDFLISASSSASPRLRVWFVSSLLHFQPHIGLHAGLDRGRVAVELHYHLISLDFLHCARHALAF
jgi:hypothetical protein